MTYAIATANPLATEAGAAILARGGSAIDAAIAVQMILTAVGPNASGIGGGAVLVVHDAGQTEGRRTVVLDGLSTAPARVTPRLAEDFDGSEIAAERAAFGGRTIGVPGALRALEAAHRRWGRLSWAELFAPAIALCEQGVPLWPYLARAMAENPAMRDVPMAQALYCGTDGRVLPAGTCVANPALATTLRRIADQGADDLYAGETARAIVDAVAGDTFPGTITLADLAGYRPVERAPIRYALADLFVECAPLPTYGGVSAGQIAGIALAAGLRGLPHTPDAEHIHILAEAMRLAHVDRFGFGDPDFGASDPQALLVPEVLARRAAAIDPGRRAASHQASAVDEGDRTQTSHISIADQHGLLLSMTTTINQNFGSRVGAAGFWLNNVLTNFATVPTQGGRPSPNRLRPGARARTTIGPSLVFDAAGAPVALLGSAGGARIVGSIASALLRLVAGERDAATLVGAPQAQVWSGPLEIEPALAGTMAGLRARGHYPHVRRLDTGTQALVLGPAGWTAAGDPRRDGAGRVGCDTAC